MAGQVPNPVREKRDLLQVLGQASPSALRVRNGVTGEVQVRASDPAGIQADVIVPLQPSPAPGERQYDLLGFAPIEWWRESASLLDAVEQGWLFVDLDEAQSQLPGAQSEPSLFDLFIARPPIETLGDMIVWNGTAWVVIPYGASGEVLTSNNPSLPTWEVPSASQTVSLLTMASGKSTDASIYEVVGAFSLNSTDFIDIKFITVGNVTAGGLTGDIQLFNFTDSTQEALSTYAGITTPTKQETGSLSLPAGEKIYEVRARVTGGTPPADRVLVSWAGLELTKG